MARFRGACTVRESCQVLTTKAAGDSDEMAQLVTGLGSDPGLVADLLGGLFLSTPTLEE